MEKEKQQASINGNGFNPQVGEYCWFEAIGLDHTNKSYWMFGKYNYDNFFVVDYLDDQIEFINCMPFISELPCFIKDKT